MAGPPARTLVRGITLLEAVASHPLGIGVTELAAITDLDKGTVSRLLTSLREVGYVQQRGSDRQYELAGRCAWLGDRYRAGGGDLALVCAPYLALLSRATGETAQLAIREGRSAVHLAECLPDRLIQVSTPTGARTDLDRTATGRAMLSVMTPDERGAAVATPGALGDIAALGWVASEVDDVTQIAVPFIDRVGRAAALAIAGPTYRIADQTEALAGQVREMVLQISLDLARTSGSVHPSYEAGRPGAPG